MINGILIPRNQTQKSKNFSTALLNKSYTEEKISKQRLLYLTKQHAFQETSLRNSFEIFYSFPFTRHQFICCSSSIFTIKYKMAQCIVQKSYYPSVFISVDTRRVFLEDNIHSWVRERNSRNKYPIIDRGITQCKKARHNVSSILITTSRTRVEYFFFNQSCN